MTHQPRRLTGPVIKSTLTALVIAFALLTGACSNRPINIKSARAVIVQNETTKKRIQGFTDTNKKTQVHVQKVQEQSKKIREQATKESDALDTVIKNLQTLLGKRP